MTFANPLGLLLLLAVPAVLVMHLFRRRLQRRRVAGLFLWSEQRLTAAAGRKRTRLLQTPSLWLEMLAALCAALWLAGPVVGDVAVRHVVVVLDDRAAMGAIHDGVTARDRAAALLRTRIGELASSDRVTLLRTGPRPEVLLGPAAPVVELAAGLAAWRPARPGHDPLPTLQFAREIAGVRGEIWWCTDRPQPAAGAGISVLATGLPAPNAALASIARYPIDGGDELRVTVLGSGGMQATGLTVRGGAPGGGPQDLQPLARRRIAFSGEPAVVTMPLPIGTGELHLQLDDDALAIDNEAWLLPPPPRTVEVCDLLPAETRAQLRMDRALAVQERWRSVADPRRAQLVFTTGPGRLGNGQHEVVIGTGEAPDPAALQAWPGPFVIDRADPLMAGVQLEGVVWVSGPLQPPGRVLVAAGDEVLCSVEDEAGGRRVWLDLAAAAGNLARAPDWPILIANLLESARREVPGVERSDAVLGDEVRYRRSMLAGAGDEHLWLVAPDGTRSEGRGLRTLGWMPTRPGRHTLVDDRARAVAAVAVRFFDPAESDLAPAATLVVEADPAAIRDRGPGDGAVDEGGFERRMLALLLLLLAVADWWVTVRGRA